MNEAELYRSLGTLTKERARWRESIPHVASLLVHDSVKIRAKALWLLGEMGLEYPQAVQGTVPAIAAFLESPAPLLRERASNALGRIGRGSFPAIEPHWADLFPLASDGEPKVRLSFIWASENIATNTPDIYGDHMAVFDALLDDADDRVRMEAPEIFRVLGKRRPGFVLPYLDRLETLDAISDSIREYGELALRHFEAEGALSEEEIKSRLTQASPYWESWFENILVNHMFFSQFPFQDRPVSLVDETVALNAVYALLRFMSIGAGDGTHERMADTVAALFRLVDHTAFDQYAVPVLKEIGEEFQLLSI